MDLEWTAAAAAGNDSGPEGPVVPLSGYLLLRDRGRGATFVAPATRALLGLERGGLETGQLKVKDGGALGAFRARVRLVAEGARAACECSWKEHDLPILVLEDLKKVSEAGCFSEREVEKALTVLEVYTEDTAAAEKRSFGKEFGGDLQALHPQANWSFYSAGENFPEAAREKYLTAAFKTFVRKSSVSLPPPGFPPAFKRLEAVVEGLFGICRMLKHPAEPLQGHHGNLFVRVLRTALLHQCRDRFVDRIGELVREPWGHDEKSLGLLEGWLENLYEAEILAVGGKDRELCSRFKVEWLPLGIPAISAANGRLFSEKEAMKNLDVYLGGYLAGLDLSRSAITGSAAMSSAFKPNVHSALQKKDHGDFLSLCYPATYTRFDGLTLNTLDNKIDFMERRRATKTEFYSLNGKKVPAGAAVERDFSFVHIGEERWELVFTVCLDKSEALRFRPKAGIAFSEEEKESTVVFTLRFPFTEEPGADVDIAVDATGEDFAEIAQKHFAAISARFPGVSLQRVVKAPAANRPVEGGEKVMYRVARGSSDDPAFREVEIYPAGLPKIATHHLGMVRLCYTAQGTGRPAFLLTPSCVRTARDGSTPNYYYFASKKKAPQDILIKYMDRGFGLRGQAGAKELMFPKSFQRVIEKRARELPRIRVGSFKNRSNTFNIRSLVCLFGVP